MLCSAVSLSIIKKKKKKEKKTDVKWAVLHIWGVSGRWRVVWANSHSFVCFSSAYCSAQPRLNLVFGGARRWEWELMSNGKYPHSSVIFSISVGQLQSSYFQRMRTDFPLDLCVIKQHNNETGCTLWFPPAAFWHLAELSSDLMTVNKEKEDVTINCCIHPVQAAINHPAADFQKQTHAE